LKRTEQKPGPHTLLAAHAPSPLHAESPSASERADDVSFAPMTAAPHNNADGKLDASSYHLFIAQHPLASHDEFLACRHAERAPRVSSLTPKLMSSFDLPASRERG
jgi:hypothetical protein